MKQNTTPHKLTPTQRAYIAGILDSDGCISISRSWARGMAYSISISVANTKVEILNWLQETTGLGEVKVFDCATQKMRWNRPNLKTLYIWRLFSNNIRIVLPQVVKYLVGKREQGEIMIKWLENPRRGRQLTEKDKKEKNEMWLRMKTLNKRGL